MNSFLVFLTDHKNSNIKELVISSTRDHSIKAGITIVKT